MTKHVPIAKVTLAIAAEGPPYVAQSTTVRQYLRTDIVFAGGGSSGAPCPYA